jgi:hypothetical protein
MGKRRKYNLMFYSQYVHVQLLTGCGVAQRVLRSSEGCGVGFDTRPAPRLGSAG